MAVRAWIVGGDGGAGGDPRSAGNGGACHAQMYTMGTILRHGSPEQKARYLPGIASGDLRLQAFGVTEPTSGTDTTRIAPSPGARGTSTSSTARRSDSRAEHSDLMVLALPHDCPRGRRQVV